MFAFTLIFNSSFQNQYVAAQDPLTDLDLCVNPSDMLRYDGPGLTVRYPCDWRAVEPKQLVAEGAEIGNYVIGFVSPQQESNRDAVAEFITINADKLIKLDVPIEDLVAAQISFLKEKFANKNFELIESTPITISGDHPGQALVYTFTDPDVGQAKKMEIITQDGDELFTIDYTAEADDFDTYLPDAQQIVSSVQFLSLPCQLYGCPIGNSAQNPSPSSPSLDVPADRIITPDCGVVTDGTPCYE